MIRIAEIMNIAPDAGENFLQKELNPDAETLHVLWECGVRNQQYYGLNNLVIKSFEYHGKSFREDMTKLTAYLASKGQLITRRRKDVAPEDRYTLSWWAPLKKLGRVLIDEPNAADLTWDDDYRNMVNGAMVEHSIVDISYNDEDWTSDFHF